MPHLSINRLRPLCACGFWEFPYNPARRVLWRKICYSDSASRQRPGAALAPRDLAVHRGVHVGSGRSAAGAAHALVRHRREFTNDLIRALQQPRSRRLTSACSTSGGVVAVSAVDGGKGDLGWPSPTSSTSHTGAESSATCTRTRTCARSRCSGSTPSMSWSGRQPLPFDHRS